MLPTSQRLDPIDRSGVQVSLGLVMQDDLGGIPDGTPQFAEQGQPARPVRVESEGVGHDTPSLVLCGVHRHVSVLQQGIEVRCVGRCGGHPE